VSCPISSTVPYHPKSLLQKKKSLLTVYFLQEERKSRGKEKEEVDLLFRMEGLMSATGRIHLQPESNLGSSPARIKPGISSNQNSAWDLVQPESSLGSSPAGNQTWDVIRKGIGVGVTWIQKPFLETGITIIEAVTAIVTYILRYRYRYLLRIHVDEKLPVHLF
jgi:hypothetical protein